MGVVSVRLRWVPAAVPPVAGDRPDWFAAAWLVCTRPACSLNADRYCRMAFPVASVLDLTNDLGAELALDQVHPGDFGLAG